MRRRRPKPDNVTPAVAGPPEEKLPDLGVLFVHGIGQQKKGETLVKFSDPLTGWLARWLTGGIHTEAAVAREGTKYVRLSDACLKGDDPAHLYVEIDGAAIPTYPKNVSEVRPQRWLLAESYWAETFEPPKTRALLFWMLLILPYMVLFQTLEQFLKVLRVKDVPPTRDGARSRLEAAGILQSKVARVGRVVVFGVVFVGALPLAAVLALVLVVLTVGVLLPIPQLSGFAKRLALLLSNTLGDAFVLVSSAAQFAAMVTQVANDVKWLADRVDKVAVVAHSQGTVVSYRAITGYANPNKLAVFVTIGQAIKKLELVLSIQTYGDPRVDFGNATKEERPGARLFRPRSLRFAFGWLGVVGASLIGYAVPQLVVVGIRQHAGLLTGVVLAAIGAGLVLVVCTIALLYWRTDLDADHAAIKRADGSDLRWADFYASSDPVSNGPLFRDPPGTTHRWHVEREVWNYGSIVRDHTSYTSSEDDFLGCMVNELFRAADITLADNEIKQLSRARWRGWWRVWWLTFARFMSVVAFTMTVIRVWPNIDAVGRRMIDWSHHHGLIRAIGRRVVDALDKVLIVGNPNRPQIVGMATVFAVGVGAYLAIGASWSYWQKRDIKRFYRRCSPEEETDPLGGRDFLTFLLVMGFCGFGTAVICYDQEYTGVWAWAHTLSWYLLLLAGGLVAIPRILARLLRCDLRWLETKLVELFPRKDR